MGIPGQWGGNALRHKKKQTNDKQSKCVLLHTMQNPTQEYFGNIYGISNQQGELNTKKTHSNFGLASCIFQKAHQLQSRCTKPSGEK